MSNSLRPHGLQHDSVMLPKHPVRLVYFSLSVLVSSPRKVWNDGLKCLKQQKSYSSVTAQADRILDRYTQDLGAGRPQSSYPNVPSWLPPFYTSHLLLLVCPCKIGLVPTTSQWKGMQMGICSRPIDSCKLDNSGFCCVCLPTIQSVILRHIHV